MKQYKITAQLQEEARGRMTANILWRDTEAKVLERHLDDVIKDVVATAVQRAREEAVKPYIESIKQIAQRLRNGGLLKTAQKIEDDLATLQTNH